MGEGQAKKGKVYLCEALGSGRVRLTVEEADDFVGNSARVHLDLEQLRELNKALDEYLRNVEEWE